MADPRFILRIGFSGLCGFVPKADGSECWVLMVDEKVPGIKKIRSHHTVVRFNLRDLAESNNIYTPMGSVGVWPINRVDLKIVSGNASPERLGLSGFGSAGPPEDSSFLHIASVEAAAKGRGFAGAGSVRPEFVRKNMTFAQGGSLAGRLHIKEGALTVTRLAAGGDDEEHPKFAVFRFRSFEGSESGGDHRQLVASEVILEIKIYDADYVEIQASPFGEEKVSEALRLRPVATGKPVEISLMNEEGEQIAKTARRKELKLKKARHQDRIFSSFYRLSSVPPPSEEAPIPVADYLIDRGQPAVAVFAPPCSPGRFNEF